MILASSPGVCVCDIVVAAAQTHADTHLQIHMSQSAFLNQCQKSQSFSHFTARAQYSRSSALNPPVNSCTRTHVHRETDTKQLLVTGKERSDALESQGHWRPALNKYYLSLSLSRHGHGLMGLQQSGPKPRALENNTPFSSFFFPFLLSLHTDDAPVATVVFSHNLLGFLFQ